MIGETGWPPLTHDKAIFPSKRSRGGGVFRHTHRAFIDRLLGMLRVLAFSASCLAFSASVHFQGRSVLRVLRFRSTKRSANASMLESGYAVHSSLLYR